MRISSAILVACLLLPAAVSQADTLGTRQQQRGAITRISKGVFQLSADSTLILGYSQEQDSSLFRSNLFGNFGVKYFLKDNLGVSLRGGVLYRKAEEARVLGWAAAVWANYYMRLGEGVFFAPGLGLGFSSAQRDTPVGDTVYRSTLTSGLVGTELMLAVFLNRRFALTAGPEFIFSVGSATPESGGDSNGVSALDGGFKVGVIYSY